MNELYYICKNSTCNRLLTSYELEKQQQHPKTLKYKICATCKRRHSKFLLNCENCGILSIDIQEKYCRECAEPMKRKMERKNYRDRHPRGNCLTCGIQLDPKIHGQRVKYCRDKCYVDDRRKRYKIWSAEYRKHPENLVQRRQYQRDYWAKTKEARQAYNKKYRETPKYRKWAREYMVKNRAKFLTVKIPKDKLDDKVYILDLVKSKQ